VVMRVTDRDLLRRLAQLERGLPPPRPRGAGSQLLLLRWAALVKAARSVVGREEREKRGEGTRVWNALDPLLRQEVLVLFGYLPTAEESWSAVCSPLANWFASLKGGRSRLPRLRPSLALESLRAWLDPAADRATGDVCTKCGLLRPRRRGKGTGLWATACPNCGGTRSREEALAHADAPPPVTPGEFAELAAWFLEKGLPWIHAHRNTVTLASGREWTGSDLHYHVHSYVKHGWMGIREFAQLAEDLRQVKALVEKSP
jgi:hypothetical protein